MVTLDTLRPGQHAVVSAIMGEGSAVYQRLMEMGVYEGVELKVIRFAPLGDPMELHVQGYNLSLRKSEAACVQVEIRESPETQK